jgi:Tfp pilus assembly protein PilO
MAQSDRPIGDRVRAHVWVFGLIAGGVVITALLIALVFAPMAASISETRRELASGQYDLDAWRRMVARRTQLRAENIVLSRHAESTGAMVERGEEPSHLLDTLIAAATKSRIDFVSIVPSEIVDHGKYREVPMEIEVRAHFHDLGKFVNEIERSSTTIKIVGMSIKTPEEEGTQGLLRISIEAVAYLVN